MSYILQRTPPRIWPQ